MQIEIRQYRTHDAAAAAAIWNEVVRGGVAFPQREELTEENADSFFRSQSFTGLAEDAERRARSSVCTSCIRTTSDAAAISATRAMR